MVSAMLNRVLVGISIALGAAVLAGACGDGGGGESARADGRPRVVAAFYPLYEAAQRVAGDRVEVVNLTPAGVEPHDLELTTRQVDSIEGADVVLFVGKGFQPGVEEVAERSQGEAIDVLEDLSVIKDADENAEEGEERHAGEKHAEGVDPHVWLDPGLLGRVAQRVEATLARIDPAGKTEYAKNAETYRRELGLLDDEYGRRLAKCPRKVMVTSHAAFGYLARRYGLTQEAIAVSPETEPDPKRLAQLVGLVRSTGTTTVFTETLVSPKVTETLAREAGVTTAVLNPLEGLTDEEVAAGETYASIMRDNLDVLTKALGCGDRG